MPIVLTSSLSWNPNTTARCIDNTCPWKSRATVVTRPSSLSRGSPPHAKPIGHQVKWIVGSRGTHSYRSILIVKLAKQTGWSSGLGSEAHWWGHALGRTSPPVKLFSSCHLLSCLLFCCLMFSAVYGFTVIYCLTASLFFLFGSQCCATHQEGMISSL